MFQSYQFFQNLAIGKQGEWQMIKFFIWLGFTQFQLKTMDNGEEELLIPVSEVRNICDPDKIIPIPKLA